MIDTTKERPGRITTATVLWEHYKDGATEATAPPVAADHVHPETVVLAALLQSALSALHYLTVMRLRELHGEGGEGLWEADAEHFAPQSAHERATAEAAMVRAAWWRATDIHASTETPFLQDGAALALLDAVDARLQRE